MSNVRLQDLDAFSDRDLYVMAIGSLMNLTAATNEQGRLLAEINDRLEEIEDTIGVER